MSLLLVTFRKVFFFFCLNYHSWWLFSLQQIQKCVFFGHSLSAIVSHSHATIKYEPSLHLRKRWKILLLFNLDLLAASLPRDRPSSLCPNTLILLIFTTFSPIVPALRTRAKRCVWRPLACFFFTNQSEQTGKVRFQCVYVCSWKHRAVAASPDVRSFSWGGSRKENPKNHQPLNFMHHNSCVCEHCMWYRAAHY